MTLLLLLSLILFDRDNNRTVYVHTGEIITIKLLAPVDNRGWAPLRLNPSILQYLGTTVEGAQPGTVYQVFAFRVVGVGSSLLDLEYRGRSGRGHNPPMNLYRIYVRANR